MKRALFDIKVIDTDAPSHRNRSPESVLESGIYEQAVSEQRGNFTPLVMSVDGLLHTEAGHFLKRPVANLAHKWETPYLCHHKGIQFAFEVLTFEVEKWTWV